MKNQTTPQPLAERLEAIRAKAINEKMVVLEAIVGLQDDKLKKDMKHLINKTLCDKSFPNALNRDEVEITSIKFDFETLECIVEEGELSDTTSIFLVALFTVNCKEITLGAWINIDYGMKLNEADFNLRTDCNDIDCNFAHGNMIKEVLSKIKEVTD